MKDDPVRPLSYAFRKSVGEMFYIGEDTPDAIVCVAYTREVPKLYKNSRSILQKVISVLRIQCGVIQGPGREIINELCDYAWDNNFKRLITLSPKTEMVL